MKTKTIALLALAGSMIALASPVSAATYVFSDSYDTKYGKGSLSGQLNLSDVESAVAGYFEVTSLTVDELTFSGTVSVFDYTLFTYVDRPYSVSLSDTTFLTEPASDVSLYNPLTQDFILKGDWGMESTTYFRSTTSEALITASNFINGDGSVGVDAKGRSAYFGTENMAVSPLAAVPEPATWAMMIGGFGLVGGTLRGRRKVAVRFA